MTKKPAMLTANFLRWNDGGKIRRVLGTGWKDAILMPNYWETLYIEKVSGLNM